MFSRLNNLGRYLQPVIGRALASGKNTTARALGPLRTVRSFGMETIDTPSSMPFKTESKEANDPMQKYRELKKGGKLTKEQYVAALSETTEFQSQFTILRDMHADGHDVELQMNELFQRLLISCRSRVVANVLTRGGISIGDMSPGNDGADLARKIYDFFYMNGIKLLPETYISALEKFAIQGNSGWSKYVLDVMRSEGIEITPQMHAIQFKAYANAGKYENLMQSYNEMAGFGEADVEIEKLLLLGLCQAGKHEESMQQFEKLKASNNADGEDYTVICSSLLRKKMAAHAQDLFAEYKDSGAEPCESLYRRFMRHHHLNNDDTSAYNLCKEVESLFAVRSDSCDALMFQIAARMDAAKVKSLLPAVWDNAIKADRPSAKHLLNAVMSVIIDRRTLYGCKIIVNEHLHDFPLLQNNSWLSAYAEGCDPNFHKIISYVDEPNTQTCEIFVRHLTFSNKYDRINALVNEMERKYLKVSNSLRNRCLEARLQLGDIDGAEQMMNFMREKRIPIVPRNLAKLAQNGLTDGPRAVNPFEEE